MEVTIGDLEERLTNINQTLSRIEKYTEEVARSLPDSESEESDQFPWAIAHFSERVADDYKVIECSFMKGYTISNLWKLAF